MQVHVQDESSSQAAIQLCLVSAIPALTDQPNAAEGYQLRVSEGTGISIAATTRAGLFYGVQSALQLLPPAPPAASSTGDGSIDVPAVLVRPDTTSCRHGVAGVKRKLPVCSLYTQADAVFKPLLSKRKLLVFTCD